MLFLLRVKDRALTKLADILEKTYRITGITWMLTSSADCLIKAFKTEREILIRMGVVDDNF